MNKRRLATVVIVIGAASIAATGIANALAQDGGHQRGQMGIMNMKQPKATETASEVWTCSMHPQIRQPKKSSCPKCGMKLIPASASKMSGGMHESATSKKPTSLEKLYTEHLPIAMASVKRAAEAVESGDKRVALVDLRKAQMLLTIIYSDLGKHVKPQFANNRCPIMNSPIKAEKVTKNLIKDYKGQKIAFCCAGCPATWDKLSDTQKQAKLAKVKPAAMQMHSEHNH